MNFRNGDSIGPDYKCSKCGLTGHRLWRQSHTFLSHIELMCATCAEANQVKQIAQYADFHQPWSTSIGDLIPARPTPEGDTFWGHTSGDVEWWYKLPQYVDYLREAKLLRIERDRFQVESEGYAKDWLETNHKLREERRVLDALIKAGADGRLVSMV